MHIGMPFIIMQQHMPHAIIFSIMVHMLCIISAIFLSPLVQVMVMPFSVFSMAHMHMPMFIMHIGMPFIIIIIDGMPPIIESHMPCIIAHMAASSQVIIIIMPPSIFFISILQRGIMPIGIMPMFMFMFIMFIGIMPGIMFIIPGIIMPFIGIMPMPMFGMVWGIIGIAIPAIRSVFIIDCLDMGSPLSKMFTGVGPGGSSNWTARQGPASGSHELLHHAAHRPPA